MLFKIIKINSFKKKDFFAIFATWFNGSKFIQNWIRTQRQVFGSDICCTLVFIMLVPWEWEQEWLVWVQGWSVV
jgi:hypothetical protein